jgi:hypothetical protein
LRREVRGLLERRLRAGGEGDIGTRLGQRRRDGAAEAPAGASDQRDLAGERAGPVGQR